MGPAPQQLLAVVVEDVLRVTCQARQLLDPQPDGTVLDLSLPGVLQRGLDAQQQALQPLQALGNGGPTAARKPRNGSGVREEAGQLRQRR